MRRLIVPTDFSDFAQEALRMALTVKRRMGAEVHLLHVVSPTPPPPGSIEELEGITGSDTHIGGPNEDGIKVALRQQAEIAGASMQDVTCAIRYSYAIAPEILTYAGEIDADTIVTGTHGRRGLRRMMLGSVAEELTRTAACDVLVAPMRTIPFSSHPARRILVPVDLLEGTDALLAFARGLAHDLGSQRVDLLHVLEPLPYPLGWLDNAVLDIVPTVRDRGAESLRKAAEAAGIEAPGIYVERGRPESIIGRVADVLESELILVAPHRQSRITKALLGSVAGGVARWAERPVLVARSLFAADPAEASGESDYTPSFL